MPNPRITHLQTGVVTLGGTAYTQNFRTMNFNYQDTEQDGRGIGERYSDPVGTKSRCTFGGSVFRTVSGVRQSMLNFTVFSIGGTSRLGILRSGSFAGQTIVDMGEGGGDQWEFPHAVGTNLSLEGDLQISNALLYNSLMTQNSMTNREVVVIGTWAGLAFTLPMKINSSGHAIDANRIQAERISLNGKGDPTSVTGEPTIVSAAVGTSAIAYSVDTGIGVYSGTDGALIMGFRVSFSSGQIIDDNFDFQTCGKPDIT